MRFTEQELSSAFKRLKALKQSYPDIENIFENFLEELENEQEDDINPLDEIIRANKANPSLANYILATNFNLTIINN